MNTIYTQCYRNEQLPACNTYKSKYENILSNRFGGKQNDRKLHR